MGDHSLLDDRALKCQSRSVKSCGPSGSQDLASLACVVLAQHALSEWRTGCRLLGKLLGETALCARKRLNQAENRFVQRGDRTQEVAGSSPASSIACSSRFSPSVQACGGPLVSGLVSTAPPRDRVVARSSSSSGRYSRSS
jgi:hypothetical protein